MWKLANSHKKPPPLKHILALTTWGQERPRSGTELIEKVNFDLGHPVKWITTKFFKVVHEKNLLSFLHEKILLLPNKKAILDNIMKYSFNVWQSHSIFPLFAKAFSNSYSDINLNIPKILRKFKDPNLKSGEP